MFSAVSEYLDDHPAPVPEEETQRKRARAAAAAALAPEPAESGGQEGSQQCQPAAAAAAPSASSGGSGGGQEPPGAGAAAVMCLPCGASPAIAAQTNADADESEGESEDDDGQGGVFYIHSDRLLKAAAKHPQHPIRSLLVHSLIDACGLLPLLSVEQECVVDRIDLTKFHSRAYVDFLRKPNAAEEEEYGCDYDCPCFPQVTIKPTISA